MEPGGEAAGVINVECIAIGRKRRGKTEGLGMNLVGCFFFFCIIERMAIWRK